MRVAIVGAGLGGLATAIACRQRGLEVALYEQAPEPGAFGAGINLSANAVKVLQALGLKDALHAVSHEPGGYAWRNWTDGSLSRILRLDGSLARYGANYYVTHRGDLHRLLQEALPASAIRLGKRCVAVETRGRVAGLGFADGTEAEADVVIGADGIHSAVRRHVFGGEGAHYAGTMCWRSLIPTDSFPKDFHDSNVNAWTGEARDRFVISYYVRQGRYINVLAVARQPDWDSESWSIPSTRAELLAAFHDVGPALGQLLGAAEGVTKWGQFMGAPTAQWTRGRVTLLGDSAHAMLATWGQGACMAFEDAWILAHWLEARADDPDAALAGYEAARKPRVTRIQDMSRFEVNFKKQSTLRDRLRREWMYLTRFGTLTPGVHRWIYGYDPRSAWRGE